MRKHSRIGKFVIIIDGEYKDKKGKIYNKESPKDGNLIVELDEDGSKITIPSFKVQITGYFDSLTIVTNKV